MRKRGTTTQRGISWSIHTARVAQQLNRTYVEGATGGGAPQRRVLCYAIRFDQSHLLYRSSSITVSVAGLKHDLWRLPFGKTMQLSPTTSATPRSSVAPSSSLIPFGGGIYANSDRFIPAALRKTAMLLGRRQSQTLCLRGTLIGQLYDSWMACLDRHQFLRLAENGPPFSRVDVVPTTRWRFKRAPKIGHLFSWTLLIEMKILRTGKVAINVHRTLRHEPVRLFCGVR